MRTLKTWLGRHLFPGSGAPRHANTTPADEWLNPYAPQSAEPHRTPYVAGERFRDYYLNEADAARAADQQPVAGWTRPLFSSQAGLQAWKGGVR